MKTILKLWNGQLGQEAINCERITRIEKKERENQKNEEAYEKFYQSLSEEQKKLYRDYEWTRGEEWCNEVDRAFIEGFKAGALLAMEALKED